MAIDSSILTWRIPMDKRSMAGYSLWDHKESDRLSIAQQALYSG